MRGELLVLALPLSFAAAFAYRSYKGDTNPKQIGILTAIIFFVAICAMSVALPTKEPLQVATKSVVQAEPKPVSNPAPNTETKTAEAPSSHKPRVTVNEFNERFLNELNFRATTMGVQPAEAMDVPERRVDGSIEIQRYSINAGAYMDEIIVTGTNNLIGVNVVAKNFDAQNLFGASLYFDCAACAYDPTVDINAVRNAIGVNYDDGDKSMSATINGVTYAKKINGSSLAFKISI